MKERLPDSPLNYRRKWEEKKTGLWGSSTRILTLENVRGELLGEVGMGGKIAMLTLNFGRSLLAFGVSGAIDYALDLTVKYTQGREQGGQTISQYGAVRRQLAEMQVASWVVSTMAWRGIHEIEKAMKRVGKDDYRGLVTFSREIIPLRSSLKVIGSEALGEVVRKGLKLHGGYGFMRAYPIERLYRDHIISEIYEGTNPINRLAFVKEILALYSESLIKEDGEKSERCKALEIAIKKANEEAEFMLDAEPSLIQEVRDRESPSGFLLPHLEEVVRDTEKLLYRVIKLSSDRYGFGLKDHQELLERFGEMMMSLYAMDSALLHARYIMESGQGIGSIASPIEVDMAEYYIHGQIAKVKELGRAILVNVVPSDPSQLKVLEYWLNDPWLRDYDLIGAENSIANYTLSRERKYSLVDQSKG